MYQSNKDQDEAKEAEASGFDGARMEANGTFCDRETWDRDSDFIIHKYCTARLVAELHNHFCNTTLGGLANGQTLEEVCSSNGRGICLESLVFGEAPHCKCNLGWTGHFCQNTDGNHTAISYRCNPQQGNWDRANCSAEMSKDAFCVPDNANCYRDVNQKYCKTGWCVLSELVKGLISLLEFLFDP